MSKFLSEQSETNKTNRSKSNEPHCVATKSFPTIIQTLVNIIPFFVKFCLMFWISGICGFYTYLKEVIL